MSTLKTDDPAPSPYEQFRRLVSSRRLQPGDRVPSLRELSRRFGLGVVAVRDALVQAEREGLIEIRPRSGAFIRSLAQIEAERRAQDEFSVRVVNGQQLHLCHARELLELETATLAATRCRPADLLPVRDALAGWHQGRASGDMKLCVESDVSFHLGIARMAGNPVVTEMLHQCLRQQHMDECALPDTPTAIRAVGMIHNDIYEAIRDQDPGRARDAMLRHMKHLENNIQKMLLVVPDPDAPQRKRAAQAREE